MERNIAVPTTNRYSLTGNTAIKFTQAKNFSNSPSGTTFWAAGVAGDRLDYYYYYAIKFTASRYNERKVYKNKDNELAWMYTDDMPKGLGAKTKTDETALALVGVVQQAQIGNRQ